MAVAAIAIRFGLYVDLMALFGFAGFGLYGLRGTERRSGTVLPFRAWSTVTAALGLVLSVLGLLALAGSMAGVSLTAVDRSSVVAVLSGTAVGTSWLVRMAALLVAFAFALLGIFRPMPSLAGVAVAGAIALASLAWSGHGDMDDGAVGWLHLMSDVVHLLASGLWLGALVALLLLVTRRADRVNRAHLILTHRALAGFSATGTLLVAAIVITGIVNAWLLVGPANAMALPSALYGRLLIAKVAVFLAMLVLAAANRFRLVPALDRAIALTDHQAEVAALWRSLLVETGCAVAVLGIVAWLGTLEPPMSM